MKDALQNDVVLGARYGYSTNASGVTSVVIGIAEKLTANKVTLEIESRRSFLYGEIYDSTWRSPSRTTSVHSCHLFPVQQNETL